ncbi:hypothetical protein Tco_1121110 [Tanacetum coccineum]|uniref:Uncharacterized protein n=1 Tax=Tanacetum coccineum TaxID=301880 RepID=A0ABQ5IWS4_9ASTR
MGGVIGLGALVGKVTVETLCVETLCVETLCVFQDAADKYVSVDFVLLEKVLGGRGALSESIKKFNRNICDLENCSFRNHLSDAKVLCALVGEWLKDLRDEVEQLQARLKFKRNIIGSLNKICCNLFPSFNHTIDKFEVLNPPRFQVWRCHGYPLDDERGNKLVKSTSCPVFTGNELAALDLIRNSLKVGEHSVLLMPSFHYYIKLQHANSPIDFNIIERTNLGSLSEAMVTRLVKKGTMLQEANINIGKSGVEEMQANGNILTTGKQLAGNEVGSTCAIKIS